ncbi:CSEP0100 putative effector protein [Blumeria hordei DH14]|uniref:CSEP0100 putative effector protein n=1 Tax=Blumeria graminis f. sp. hordei (strain DH14) TaxID=546991 RepID=N1JIU3_BLUG1|nr:CSEP0100 putative effector protein [Blumeria hordei DH14]
MKFLSAAYTAAFSGLLLSASAFLMNPYFACSNDLNIYLSAIDHHERPDFYSEAQPGDPTDAQGNSCTAYRHTARVNGVDVLILIQLSYEFPYNRVFERTETGWQECPYYPY